KELIVDIDVVDLTKINIGEFIDEIEDVVGIGNVYAVTKCRPNIIQVALNSKENAEKLCNGLSVNDKTFDCNFAYSPYTIVSFMDIPSYIEDIVLINKLRIFNIEIEGKVIRHYYDKYETIENGIRHVKCIFPPDVKSLPWAVNLETIHGFKSFRVIHNNQTKVCHKCLQDSHVIANCPKIECRKCHQLGHMANKCTVKYCEICKKLDINCVCSNYFDDDINSTSNELLSDNSLANQDIESKVNKSVSKQSNNSS
ncbi:hypothetical protein LOTGIDRAFT_74358, partial [Lottia gigantea]